MSRQPGAQGSVALGPIDGRGGAVGDGGVTCSPAVPVSSFAGFLFPPDMILLAVRWYLRYNLSYRDLEELLAERGVEVDHVTLFRWVQRFTPLLVGAARPRRHGAGDRWVPGHAASPRRHVHPARCSLR